MAMEVDVAIVGGGLGGLALALGLQERGIRAHVFEKAARVRVHSGTGISIAINGIRALEGIKPGLSQKFLESGQHITHMTTVFSRLEGEPKQVNVYPWGRENNMIMMPWKSAQQNLADEILEQSLIHWRHSLVEYKVIEGGTEARFEVSEEEVNPSPPRLQIVRAKLLVGADGIRSQVRNIMVGDELRDLFLITWNALIPKGTVRSLNLHLHEDNEIKVFSFTYKKMLLYLSDCGGSSTLWQVRTPDESGEITKAYASDLEAHGLDVRKVRALRQIKGMDDLEHMRTAMEATDPGTVREARAFDRLPLTSWSDPSKRVLLIGDAAHGMYPGPGEGARTVFEDVHQLSMLLHEAFANAPPAIPEAVTRFEKLRIPRCTKIQAYAAERTYWPQFTPEWVKNLTPEEQQKRSKEFGDWVRKYPEFMAGDPGSTYWKP